MTLDLRSLIALTAASLAMLALMMGLLQRSLPRPIPGLRHWTIGLAVLALAGLLLTARGLVPDGLSIGVGNALVLLGTMWLLWGMQAFYRRAPVVLPWAVALAVVMAVVVWAGFIRPDVGIRTFAVSSLWAAILFATGLTIARHDRQRFGARFAMGALFLHSAMVTLRAITALQAQAGADLLTATPMQTVYIGVNTLMTLALPIGLVLMAGERLREEIEHQATHDALTGVLSRGPILAQCEAEILRSRRLGHPMSLCLVDIDHFKAINDTHGHQAGDRVLVSFAQRAAAALRPYDRIGRYGGEEFLLLLPETGAEAAHGVAERIRAAVAQPAEALPVITASFGVAVLGPGDADINAVLGRADSALYAAKAGGRNRVESA